MDTLECMRAFAAVVEAGGFSAAGRRLDLSKARVSKYVAQLEGRIGGRLLHRSTRRVEPTTLGQAYYERAAPLLEEMLALEESVRQSQSRLDGALRIAAPVSFAETHLVPALVGFATAHPQLRFDLLLNDREVDLVAEGVDLAVRIGHLGDSALVARPLGSFRLVLCASRDYLATSPPLTSVTDLARHRCIVDSNTGDGQRWPFAEPSGPLPVQGRFRVNSARAVRELLLAGQGVGICPGFMVENDLRSGRLQALLPELGLPAVGLYAIYPHRRHLARKVRALIDYLQAYFNGDPARTAG